MESQQPAEGLIVDEQQQQLEMRARLKPGFDTLVAEYIQVQADLASIADTVVKPKKRRLEELRSALLDDMESAKIKRVRDSTHGFLLSVAERTVEVKPKAEDHLNNAKQFFGGNTEMAEKALDQIFKPIRVEKRPTLVCKKDQPKKPKKTVAQTVFQL